MVQPGNPAGVAVASGDNRLNNAGYLAPSGKGRTASIINTIIAPGQNLTFPQAGDNFYFILLTAPILARPSNGVFNSFETGTGYAADPGNYFALVELTNPNAFNVVVSFFIGFGGYIDNRVIIANGFIFNVAKPTFPVAAGAATAFCQDISGSVFTDINGRSWIALSRQSIVICNLDVSSVVLVTSFVPGPNSLAAVQPLTSIALPMTGNLAVTINNSAPMNAYVSEIYSAIAKT